MGLKVDGIDGVSTELAGIVERLLDLSPALEVVGAATVTVTDDAFENQRSPSGAEWDDLSPTTVAMRVRKRGPAALPARRLIDTSRLRQSITTRASASSFTFGSNVVYAAAQHFGNPNNRMFGGKRAPIPPRPFFPVEMTGDGLDVMQGGDAGEHWQYVNDVVTRYITSGEL